MHPRYALFLLPKDKFWILPNQKFTDDNFKFGESSRKFSKRVENAVGKGQIAHNEQFLVFPQCFQRLILQTRKNQGLFGKGSTLYQMTIFFLLNKLKALTDDKSSIGKIIIFNLDRVEKIVGKGENAVYQHFLLFSQCFQKASSSCSIKVGIV